MVFTPQANYIILEPNTPVRLRVKAARQEDRPITDPVSRQPKIINVLVLDVTELNGQPLAKELSFTSFKAQQALAPLLNSGEAFRRILEVTYRPKGFATEYEFRVL
mgnify:CR=1 FL=1